MAHQIRSLGFVGLAAVLLLTAMPLAAQRGPVMEQVPPAQILQYLGELGFGDATLDEDGDVVFKMQGYEILIFVGSSQGKYLLIKFAVTGSTATIPMMNEWNRTKKYSRAYIDVDGDAMLESDLDLEGGVTPDRIKSFLRTFDLSLADFLKHIS